MPIHDFSFNPKQINAGVQPQPKPVVPQELPNQVDTNRVEAETHDETQIDVDDAFRFLPNGFRTMDRGVKEFFSNIMVPTKDGSRSEPVAIRVAGGDKSILFWKQDLDAGRIKLPVISVNRTNWQFNPKKFSTPHLPAYRRFANKDGTRMIRFPREWPCLINYTLSIWAERKRDIEYIEYQIVTRFNPVAEWKVQDAYCTGNIFATYEGSTDNSDIDQDANQLAKVRYDVNIQIEGWLPLPGKITPTVLGRIQTLHECNGTFLDVLENQSSFDLSPEPFDLSE